MNNKLIIIGLIGIVLFVSSCGFHLRPDKVYVIKSIYVTTDNQLMKYSVLNALKGAGFSVMEPSKDSWQLIIADILQNQQLISLGSQSDTRRYDTRYALSYSLIDNVGTIIISPTSLNISRDYVVDPTQRHNMGATEFMLQEEMRQTLAQQIIFHLQKISRENSS